MHRLWKNIINILSIVFILGGFVLQYLSKKYMGMSRSLAYRHDLYMEGIFEQQMLKSQLGVTISVAVIALVAYLKLGKGMYKDLRVLLFSAGIFCGLNMMMINHPPLWVPYVYVGVGAYFLKSTLMFYQSITIK